MHEIKKRANGKGCAIFLGKGRQKPWGARITIGKDKDGKAIRYIINTFGTELDALICLENYHRSPYPIYIKEDKYNRIETFSKIPYPLIPVENPKKKNIEKIKKDTYTFKQLYEKFKEEKMLTKEEMEQEKKYHVRPRNKPFGRHHCRGLTTAFNNSELLYDRVYKKEIPKNKLFTYDQINYLWNFVPKSSGRQKENKQERETFIRNFWLMLIYSGCRADELISIYTDNIFLEDNYFIGGLKTEAGINRRIPIHPSVKHLYEKYYNPNNEFLFMQPNGNKIDYDYYLY